MSLIRSLFFHLSRFLFTLFLCITLILFSAKELTAYEKIKPLALDTIKTQMISTQNLTQVSELYQRLTFYCQVSPETNLTLNLEVFNLSINCSMVLNRTEEEFIDFISSQVFENVYHKRYECEFVECIKSGKRENLLVLMSEKAYVFFSEMFNYSLWITIFLAILVVIISPNIYDGLRSIGFPLLGVSVFYFILGFALDRLVPSTFILRDLVIRLSTSFNEFYLLVLIIGGSIVFLSYLIERIKKK